MNPSNRIAHARPDDMANAEVVRCSLVGVSELIAMLPDVLEVRAERPGKRVTDDMAAVADCLLHLATLRRRQDRDERLVARLKRAISDGLDAVWLGARAHALAGLSADGTILVVLFADRGEAREMPLQR